jgi:hypothetical protein
MSIPDVKEYNMYGDEDLFLHEAPWTSFFKFHYNRKIVHYQILENIIGLWQGDMLYTESLGSGLV